MSNEDTFSPAVGGMAGIHPTRVVDAMVMKAAKSLCKQHAKRKEVCPKLYWREYSEYLVADAQAALTGCGALECFEALECLTEHVEYRSGDEECRPLENAKTAIAKVYGSAPE